MRQFLLQNVMVSIRVNIVIFWRMATQCVSTGLTLLVYFFVSAKDDNEVSAHNTLWAKYLQDAFNSTLFTLVSKCKLHFKAMCMVCSVSGITRMRS